MNPRKKVIGQLLVISTLLAAALTWFYLVHEGLPKFVRAPTSLLLAPVAIVDGLCYAMGISGIYGKLVPIFLVNWIAAAAFYLVLVVIKRKLFHAQSSRSV